MRQRRHRCVSSEKQDVNHYKTERESQPNALNSTGDHWRPSKSPTMSDEHRTARKVYDKGKMKLDSGDTGQVIRKAMLTPASPTRLPEESCFETCPGQWTLRSWCGSKTNCDCVKHWLLQLDQSQETRKVETEGTCSARLVQKMNYHWTTNVSTRCLQKTVRCQMNTSDERLVINYKPQLLIFFAGVSFFLDSIWPI